MSNPDSEVNTTETELNDQEVNRESDPYFAAPSDYDGGYEQEFQELINLYHW